MVRIPGFHCCGPGSIPGWGTEVLQAAQRGQKKKNLYISTLIPFMRALLSSPKYLPKSPPLNTMTLGVRISTYELGGDKHSDHSTRTMHILPPQYHT